MQYDVVITSYSYVFSEWRRRLKFLERVKDYQRNQKGPLPKRPYLTLFSDIWGEKQIGHFLILDDAHTLKNLSQQKYDALKRLSESFKVSVMMTNEPIDHTWKGASALLGILHGR